MPPRILVSIPFPWVKGTQPVWPNKTLVCLWVFFFLPCGWQILRSASGVKLRCQATGGSCFIQIKRKKNLSEAKKTSKHIHVPVRFSAHFEVTAILNCPCSDCPWPTFRKIEHKTCQNLVWLGIFSLFCVCEILRKIYILDTNLLVFVRWSSLCCRGWKLTDRQKILCR